jgi:hypothetical protein
MKLNLLVFDVVYDQKQSRYLSFALYHSLQYTWLSRSIVDMAQKHSFLFQKSLSVIQEEPVNQTLSS